MTKSIVVYTKNKCPECEKMKFNLGYLPQEVKDKYNIEYRNIDDEEKYRTELEELGYKSVPITFVEEYETAIVGFEFGELQDAVGL